MSCYYEDMIEKIMKEALTEKYWEKMIKYHLDYRFLFVLLSLTWY